jgi:hypothetical protein
MAWLRTTLGGLLGSKADKRGNTNKNAHYHITNPYHAVSIVPGAMCCSAARDLRSQRFLSREAPPLPLAGCTVSPCRCSYKHFDDRRMKSRRSIDRMGQTAPWNGNERRAASGRRQTDA